MRGNFDIDGGNFILERCKLLMKALSLRLDSMSFSDNHEFAIEFYRLTLASVNWPENQDLLFSLKKYSLEELNALRTLRKPTKPNKDEKNIDIPKN